jgi:type IV secretion system protein VirB2
LLRVIPAFFNNLVYKGFIMKTQTKDLALSWQVSLLVMLSAVVVMLPDMAFAVTATDTVIGNMMCIVTGWFLGSAGKGLATLAIIIIGVGALMGKVSWGMAIIVGLGIALIFGAAALVNSLAGGGGGTIAGC